MAFTYVTGACWVTVARYPLLCVNLITALRVIWHLSPACSSGFLFVQQWCMQFQGGLVIISFRETLRLFHGWYLHQASKGPEINSGRGAGRDLDDSSFLHYQIIG